MRYLYCRYISLPLKLFPLNTLKTYPYPIPSRENILEFLRSSKDACDAETIARLLGAKESEFDGVFKRLAAMTRDGQIRVDRQGKYQVESDTAFILGKVSSHADGYGFFIPEAGGEDIFLPEHEMSKVLHGDRVHVRVMGLDRRGRPEGTIVEVVERANTDVIGRLLRENGVWLLAPEDKRFNQDVIVAGDVGKAQVGQIVRVEITQQPSRYTQPVGKLVEILGSMDDPGIEIEIAVRKFGVPHMFSDAVVEQAESLSPEVLEEDKAGRVDLRDIPLVTIDGEDARDFDDAVYCERVEFEGKNAFRMLVAIADVSHYVKPNEPLDVDALERSTSVYFPRRVIPMLPEKLSNGLCSLNPSVDRLTLVCDAIITEDGAVVAYQFYPAVMHSAARFTYTQVAAILEDTEGLEASRHPPLVSHLIDLYALFKVLNAARKKRGAIDFDMAETYIVCDNNGKIEKIVPRERNDAHRLIEECMLAANVCAADFLARNDQHALYRTHAGPSLERLNKLKSFLKQSGLNLEGGDTPTPADYARLMEEVKSRPDATVVQTMLLRSMQQAVYSPDNIGHFGLSYDAYAHFTSPIRRYPDLLTHRAIKAVINGKHYTPSGISEGTLNTDMSNQMRERQLRDQAKGISKPETEHTIWDALGVHCSANERRADDASRDVESWLKCYFMRDKLGMTFQGTISGVTAFGIFVQLEDMFIEGMVHISELGGDYFQFNEARHALIGEHTGKRYGLTDRVKVQVSRVDLDARRIDLRMADMPSRSGSPRSSRQNMSSARETPEAREVTRKGRKKQVSPVKKSNPSRSAKATSVGKKSRKAKINTLKRTK